MPLGDSEGSLEAIDRLTEAASSRQHTILFGPPGTGKTHLLSIFGDSREPYNSEMEGLEKFTISLNGGVERWLTCMIPFTPSSSEADLLWGLTVDKTGTIKPGPGWLSQFNDCLDDENIDGGLFIIDEMSRADIVGAFGSLLTGIEHGNIQNKYSEKPLILSKKLFIVGTMNTADKSVKQIDFAFRRRFKWIPMLPNYDLIEEWADLVDDGLDNDPEWPEGFAHRYRRFAEMLNDSIKSDKLAGAHLQLGQTLFFPMKILSTTLNDNSEKFRLEDLLEHLRSVLLPQLVAYVGSSGINRLQSWLTPGDIPRKAMELEYYEISNNDLLGMIRIVSCVPADDS